MARRLVDLLTVLSAALFVATIALWVRSFVVSDQLTREAGPNNITARASRGRVWVFRWSMESPGGKPSQWSYASDRPALIRDGRDPWVERYWSTPALTFRGGRSPSIGAAYWDVIVPLWLPAILFAVAPAWWVTRERTRRRRRRRERAGLCTRCGYDLRASPEICPECGAAGLGRRLDSPATRRLHFRQHGG